ncbi:uncharacterized protein LOC110944460 [Helianthus annuus]|uniref:uncharacterized protein LOC110944460 n=1 Tax=Helianthus annuus TaxID=4232 RepID=UPI000B8FF873|nr:uncharacterized protein LOC110944460 [Helianthus annuus]
MDSPSSSSMLNCCYHEFFADGDGSTDEEVEQEAVTGACKLAMRYAEHCRRPQAKKGKRGYIERDRRGAHDRLMKDYFDEEPTYSNEMFRRRFRMSKRLFLRIVHDLEANYDFFKQKADARGELGFTGIQKCTSALRILAYGNTTDINDEYLKMGEKTTRDSLEHFCRGIIDVYGARYLRTPTWDDLQKIYEVHNAQHGLPGPDSHNHLFFECEFSAQVWNDVKGLAGMDTIQNNWTDIFEYLLGIANDKSTNHVISKLVMSASAYFIWEERNRRLFTNRKRSKNQLVEVIRSTVKMKLHTMRFKSSTQTERALQQWMLPRGLLIPDDDNG